MTDTSKIPVYSIVRFVDLEVGDRFTAYITFGAVFEKIAGDRARSSLNGFETVMFADDKVQLVP